MTNDLKIVNRQLAIRVLDVVDAGLVSGLGINKPGHMCVEAAVCYAMGLPHSDKPTCVSPAVRSLKIKLNDSSWPSNAARTKGMRRLAIAQLGTKDNFDDKEFAKRVAKYTIQVILPIALRAAALLNPYHAEKLNNAAVVCEEQGTKESAYYAANVASAANAASAANYAAYAAYAASAACAASSANYAANVASAANAASAANYAAYAAYNAARAAKKDEILSKFAEGVVQILIFMKAKGTEFLDLAPY